MVLEQGGASWRGERIAGKLNHGLQICFVLVDATSQISRHFVKATFVTWSPPVPLGWFHSLLQGKVHFDAVLAGLDMTVALSFLYMIRCSLHGAALKRSVPNLSRKTTKSLATSPHHAKRIDRAHRRIFSEAIDIEQGSSQLFPSGEQEVVTEHPPQTKHDLKEILLAYAHSQYISALVGGFAITPSVAAAPTMFELRAEHVAPQLGSVLLLLMGYVTNFEIVCYVPKQAFSSVLILACIDMLLSWCVKSYKRTNDKHEWLVVPLIVLFSFMVGLLSAVFLGLALSTFFFVASFFRTGVGKSTTVSCSL